MKQKLFKNRVVVIKKYFRIFVSFLSLIMIVGLIFVSNASVFAGPSFGGISMEPIPRVEDTKIRHSFKYIIAEGEELRDEVVLSNSKDTNVTIFLLSSGYNLLEGELVKLKYEPGDLQDPGYWVKFDKQIVPVPPNSSRTVGFTLSVPDWADVGDHTGTILISEKKPASKTKGGTGLSIVSQVGAQLVVNIPGDVERDFVIDDISHAINRSDNRALNFHFNATNNGNVTIQPRVDATVRGLFGKVGELKDIKVTALQRDSSAELLLPWNKRAPYIGRFVANFKFHLGEHTQYNKDGTTILLPDEIIEARYVYWIVPGVEILYLVFFVLIMYLLRSLWLYLVISRRLRTKTKMYKIIKNDTLTGIAAKFGADPRVLAKFNMMKWPYEVKVGENLLVPIGRMIGDEWKSQTGTMLGDKEIMGGIFGHLFRRRSLHHMTRKFMGDSVTKKLDDNMEILVAEKGDTITDVAEFAGIGLDKLIELNNLRPPYRLRVSQELIVPKSTPKKTAKKTQKTQKKRKDK